ncbi:hypothetical protein [Fundidesulfovibrio soli]|uniref:hypothetical protein n=1 Tax=Fundidesulfovibrio soli TaxID=2922716 RepID=UPI001FAEB4AC|nr:hypothetical protein [Fundidesulfovibrio soli]
MHQEPGDGPLIGPDGGMAGRGIKAAGDWYQGYIGENRDSIMQTMEHELNKTITPQFVDGVKAWSTGRLDGIAGTDASEKPEYLTSYLVAPHQALQLLPRTGILASGLKPRVNPVVPLAIGVAEAYDKGSLTAREGWTMGKAIFGGVRDLPPEAINSPVARAVPEGVWSKQDESTR